MGQKQNTAVVNNVQPLPEQPRKQQAKAEVVKQYRPKQQTEQAYVIPEPPKAEPVVEAAVEDIKPKSARKQKKAKAEPEVAANPSESTNNTEEVQALKAVIAKQRSQIQNLESELDDCRADLLLAQQTRQSEDMSQRHSNADLMAELRKAQEQLQQQQTVNKALAAKAIMFERQFTQEAKKRHELEKLTAGPNLSNLRHNNNNYP